MVFIRKVISYLLVSIIVVTVFSSCKETAPKVQPSKPDNKLISDWRIGDNISLNWFIDLKKWGYTKEWKEYPTLNEISNITGVVPVIIFPMRDVNEKIDAMIAANDLPDIVTLNQTDSHIEELVRKELVYSFDELIQRYVPQFMNEIDKEIWKYSKDDDGKLYGLANNFISKEKYAQKTGLGLITYNVRNDIYKEMGSPDMSTPDSFINALRKFKSRYPVINGKPSIPLSILGYEDKQLNIIERSFGINDFYEDENQKLYIKYKDPKYIMLITFINKLYREGLIDPQALIKQKEQISEDLSSGLVFAAPMQYKSLDDVNIALEKIKPNSHFIAIEPMRTETGISFPGINRLGDTVTLITKKSNKPEEAIKFIRYLWCKQGSLLANNKAVTKGKDTYEINGKLADKYVMDNTVYSYNMNPSIDSELVVINSKINDIIKRSMGKAIMAPSEESTYAYFQEMLRKMKSEGLDQLEAYWSVRLKLNKEKFD